MEGGIDKRHTSFPFKETTQKSYETHNFCLRFILCRETAQWQGNLGNTATLCSAKNPGSVNFQLRGKV